MTIRTRRLCAILALSLLLTAAPLSTAWAEADTPKLIALTFDDGPSAQTARLLDGLEERGAVATFFLCGKNGDNGLYRYSALVSRMLAIGCEPGNHSNGHPAFSKLSGERIGWEISAVEEALYQQAGSAYTELVRIPYGENNATIRRSVGRPIIQWSVDPQDWKYRDADIVYRNILNHAFDGAIILLHDLYATSVDAALRAVDTLRGQGYEFVTVSELFRRRGVELQDGRRYYSAPNRGVTLAAYGVPEISLAEGADGSVYATVSAPDSGLAFRYTTDGSVPTLGSPLYTEPLLISSDTYLRVAGFDRFATRTPVTARFIRAVAAAPQIALWENGLLSLSSPTQAAAIYYTTDGSDPKTSGTRYTAPFAPGAVTRAVARADAMAVSRETALVRLGDALFRDVPADAPYLAAVDDMVARGLMSGEGDWRFAPQSSTTRAAIVTALYRLAQASAPAEQSPFLDVPDGSWYTKPVRWAYAEGLVSGMTADSFAPGGTLTWEQAAVLLRRYAAHAGIPSRKAHGSNTPAFPGASSYAVESLAWCAANGIPYALPGENTLPTAPVPRAGLAMMLSALCELAEGAA